MKNIITNKVLHKTARAILVICFSVMVVSVNAQSSMAKELNKGNLVTVSWLEKYFKNTDMGLLDASPSQIYSTKHIPSALS